MKLKTFLYNLQELAKANPEILEYKVVVDMGVCFSLVGCEPTIGRFAVDEFCVQLGEDEKNNAILIN